MRSEDTGNHVSRNSSRTDTRLVLCVTSPEEIVNKMSNSGALSLARAARVHHCVESVVLSRECNPKCTTLSAFSSLSHGIIRMRGRSLANSLELRCIL